MDGNRRWAKEHGLPVLEGHRRAATKVLEPLIEHAADLGIEYITLWAWSTENWKRAQEEVGGIMKLLRWGFDTYGARMHKKGMRIQVIGDTSKLDEDIRDSLARLIELTKNNTRITVIFALNYGGRDEIMRAIKKVSSIKGQVSGKNLTLDTLTPDTFSSILDTAGVPDPDIIVRPGGEKRLSGFLLWQSQYAELYFADWYMPEFMPAQLDEVVEEFAKRKRRFGR
jgi:undecaprenyl diphosphate synthase